MPYKFRARPVKEAPRKSPLPRIIAILLLVAFLTALPQVWKRYQARNERHRLIRAQQALVHGEYKSALLEARAVLVRSPQNSIALGIVERATEAMKAPETMSWRRTTAMIERGDTDQLLGIAEAFISVKDFATAERALKGVDEGQRNTARYHDLLGRLAAARNDLTAARTEWEEAVRLAPDDEEYRIKPISIRLVGDPAERTEALAQLDAMKQNERGAFPALRALIADAQQHQDFARRRELAAELAAAPGAEFADQLVLLDALQSLRPKRDAEFNAHLAELQKIAAANPKDVVTLAGWLLDHNLAFRVAEWAAELPPESFTQPPCAPALAQAYVSMSDRERLEKLVDSTDWGDQEFLRLAFFSHALERLGNQKAAETIWHDAFAAAQPSPERLERLARACDVWGWRERMEEVLWKLGPSEWCPRWAMDFLWAAAIAHSDTARLNEVAKLRLRMDPKNVAMRNNQANLTLLLGQADEATQREVLAVHQEVPGSAAIASTYALSLFLQGRVDEAVSTMEAYPPEQLGMPAVAPYFGAYLAAAGQVERALEYLHMAAGAAKLPEEAALVRVFGAVSEARIRQQKGETEAANTAWAEALRGCDHQPAWLDLLAKIALDSKWPAAADAALLQLAAEDRCPPGAEEQLWVAASKIGNGTQIYRASKMLARVRPNDATIRSRYVLLAVLGQRTKESTVALAEQLNRDFPHNSEASAALALAFVQQGKMDRAEEVMNGLPAAQQEEPRVAFYSGIILAAAARCDEAEPKVEAGASSVQYEEERSLLAMLRAAFSTARSERNGAPQAADGYWALALNTAGDRMDWVEMLARIGGATAARRHADAALWKLAASENCPAWAVETLWASASKNGTSIERYRASKLVAKSDPKNLNARCNWIILGLLTNQELDAPNREAKSVYSTNISDTSAAIAYALSLFLQNQREEALIILGGLPAAQIAEPRTSLYFGIFLAAGGETENAGDCLRAAAQANLFPEERAFADQVVKAEPLRAILSAWPPAAQ